MPVLSHRHWSLERWPAGRGATVLADTAHSSPASHRTPASAADVHPGPTRALAHCKCAKARCCCPSSIHLCAACLTTRPSGRRPASSSPDSAAKRRWPPKLVSHPAAHMAVRHGRANEGPAPRCPANLRRGPSLLCPQAPTTVACTARALIEARRLATVGFLPPALLLRHILHI